MRLLPHFKDDRHMAVFRLSAVHTGLLRLPRNISVTGWVEPSSATVSAGRIISTINSSDTIGNRTRDLPAYSAAPQATALPWSYLQFLSRSPALGHSACHYTTHRDIDPPDPIFLVSTSLREPQMNQAASDRPGHQALGSQTPPTYSTTAYHTQLPNYEEN